jgi:Tfp pilus assembly protein PilF
MKPPHGILAAVVMLAALSGCGGARGPYASNGEQARDIQQAANRYQSAVAVIDSDPAAAEDLLREALGFDLYHGAAHNNLGVLLMEKGRLYDASEEFEWARKLLPGHPEPRVNLAIALHRGGKVLDALAAARTALEVRPGDLPALQTLAYIQVREGLANAETIADLDTIALRSGDPHWTSWARRQRALLEAKVHP